MSGITDSAISSNAWKPWFLRVLKSRPEFQSEDIAGDILNCDACNISRRYMIRFLSEELMLGMPPMLLVSADQSMIPTPWRYGPAILMLIPDSGVRESTVLLLGQRK